MSPICTHLITALFNKSGGNVHPRKAQHKNLLQRRRDSLDMKLKCIHRNSVSQNSSKATVRRFPGESPSETTRGMGLASRGHTFSELLETCCLQSPPRLCCQGLISWGGGRGGIAHTHTPTESPQPLPPPHIWIFLNLKFPDQPYLFGTAPPPGLDSHLITSESPESRA